MRIVHVTHRYYPNIGGIEVFSRELCERLFKKGLNVKVYSLDYSKTCSQRECVNGIVVQRYRPLAGYPSYVPSFQFLGDLKKESPAILHVHNIQNVFPLLTSLLRGRNQKVVLQPHYHQHGQTLVRQALLDLHKVLVSKFVLDRSSIVIANSPYEVKILRKDYPAISNLVMLPEGLNLDELKTVRRNPAHPARILYVGALREYKRVDALLKAFKYLLRNEKRLRLVIIGDGPQKYELLRLATDLGIDSNIEWKQYLSRRQLLHEYETASVFVSLSLFESFGRAVNEAITIGLPTVVSGSAAFASFGKNEMVEHTTTHPKSIAAAIMVAKSKTMRSMAEQYRRFQDIEEYVNHLIKIYAALWRRIESNGAS